MSLRRMNRFSLRTASLALTVADLYWGSPSPTRSPMMLRTMMSSISVKPRSPIPVTCSVEGQSLAFRVDIVHILLSPDVRIGIVLVGPEPPVEGIGHGVLGDAAEELNHLLATPLALGVLVLDLAPLDQGLQSGGISFGILVDLGFLLVGELLVGVDGLAHQTQRSLQLDLVLPLDGYLTERQGGQGENGEERKGDDHLRDGEAR